MKRILLLILPALISVSVYAANTRTVIFEFAVDGCPQNIGKETATYLASAIAYLDGFEVVDPNIVQKLCDNEKVESYDVDIPMAVKIGRSTHTNSANLATLGKVEKDGSTYKVTVTYVDLRTGEVMATKSASGSGIYSLSRSVDKIVGLLE